ncbi:class I SAM-dependent methyltransferase [Pseudorhodoferax sp.]|uniref:class I SAM-dependent methyltransferase n=1 Tax=Pseudorhodoferax sp. TaxID=1993553 RepID=UPI002DD68DEA|nr:class I SAM-dependent methyltransferase [Pseudorhodoferax sp.]
MPPATADYIAANLANWNERADIHVRDETGFYGIDALLAGANLLMPIEAAELGDVAGLRLAHFQCHIGTDSLSLARLGADVVGLDFSPAAIAHAQRLAQRCGLTARFVEGSVYDAASLLGTGFDRVFTTWGTVYWLDDIAAWARAVAAVLAPGGKLYFADTHPEVYQFEADASGRLVLRQDFRTAATAPLASDEATSYDGSGQRLQNMRIYEWLHSPSDILNALIGAGLRIDFVREHEALPWRPYPGMVHGADRLFRLPAGHVRLPLALSIGATRTG